MFSVPALVCKFTIALTVLAAPCLSVTKPRSRGQEKFPVSANIKEQIQFWQRIFTNYDSKTVVIHDSVFPTRIIDVIEFKTFAKKFNKGIPYSRKEKSKIIRRYIKRYKLAIRRFGSQGRKALQYGAMENRLYNVMKEDQRALRQLMRGKSAIRSQTGLADEFEKAALRAEKLLPYMERIFQDKNLPIALTRIAFVESMFNTKARSRRGASGVWQFMPATARRYMVVNRFIDERNSPLKATEAAASLLAHNYTRLKSWPLAITAYNHGLAGMRRVVKRSGTGNFGKIVQKYRSKTFGFASRNFYAEFLAAKNVYEKRFRKPISKNHNPMKIAFIRLPSRLSIHQLLAQTPLDDKMLKLHNPCLSQRAYTSHKHRKLPRNFDIIIPQTMAPKIKQALNQRNLRKG